MARIVAIANQKGGVGKSTTALALGTALADRSQRVLLVDLDPQSSLTIAAGSDPDTLEVTLYDIMSQFLKEHDTPGLESLLRPLGDRLDLIPTSIDLAAAEVELLNAVRREYVLGRLLRPVRASYDLILIDCPPSLSLLTLNALTVADEVLIPLVPEFLAARGVGYLLNTIQRVRTSELNPHLGIAGVLLTMVDNRTTHGREIAAAVRQRLDGQVAILGEIKRSIKASEASARGVSVLRYAAESDVALAYGDVAGTLLRTWAHTAPDASVAEVQRG